MKKITWRSRAAALILALVLIVSGAPAVMAENVEAGTGTIGSVQAGGADTMDDVQAGVTDDSGAIEIYFTNDVHCAYEKYAKVASVVGPEDFLIDAGDNIQGKVAGVISDGGYMVDIMNKMDYDVAVPGNHEFDYGMERFLEIAGADGEGGANGDGKADFPYLASNFKNLKTGENVLDSFMIFDFDGTKVAVVGAVTPETLGSSNPKNFKDADGQWLYDFCGDDTGDLLAESVQKAVDAAIAEGAEYVIAVTHMGEADVTPHWASGELIAKTTGIDVLIDGHSHNIYEADVKNKDGDIVKAVQTGTELKNLGKLTIRDGVIDTELIDVEGLEEDPEMEAYLAGITEEAEKATGKVVGRTEIDLVIYDPETGDRIVRDRETNLGDFVADAYREVLKTDVAIINGGGIRANLEKGEITLADLIAVNPYGNTVCALEVTGQQLLDAIELTCYLLPEENGSFLQVSGMTYTINKGIPSSVKINEKGEFVSIDGPYRVSDVMIGGEPLDPDKLYSVGSHNYMLIDLGSGMMMFKDAKVLMEEVALDYQVVIDYLTDTLGGVVKADSIYADPYGSGRVTIIDEADPCGAFTDVTAEDWFHDGVDYVLNAGYMNGTSGTAFSPYADTTRGMLMTILARMAGVDTTDSAPWYQAGLDWAVENEVSDGTFPEAVMTREQLVTMLYRYSGYAGPGPDTTISQGSSSAGDTGNDDPDNALVEDEFITLDDFVDADSVNDWAREAMAWAVECGIITGIADGEGNLSLDPQGTTLRCQLAVIMQRYDALMEI